MSDSEKLVDPVMRTASAMSRGRPLSKAFSLSTPNVAGLMDSDTEILDRIRDLEEQIAMQQVGTVRCVLFSNSHTFTFYTRRQSALSRGKLLSSEL